MGTTIFLPTQRELKCTHQVKSTEVFKMSIEIIDGFKFLIGTKNSKKLVVESERLEEYIEYIESGKASDISINSFMGYKLPDISFINRIKDKIEGLHIPETKYDIQGINALHNLKTLGFADNGKDTIDLSNFPELTSLACDYSKRLIHLESCTKLIGLSLTGYKPTCRSLIESPELPNIERISLYKANIVTLNGIEKFQRLSELNLYGLSKLEKIESLIGLKESLAQIEIENCKKISDYYFLGELKNLHKLIISDSGQIENLSFIQKMTNLKFLSFVGTNILDGDISHCLHLDYVGFDDKRHYSHKMKQLKKK